MFCSLSPSPVNKPTIIEVTHIKWWIKDRVETQTQTQWIWILFLFIKSVLFMWHKFTRIFIERFTLALPMHRIFTISFEAHYKSKPANTLDAFRYSIDWDACSISLFDWEDFNVAIAHMHKYLLIYQKNDVDFSGNEFSYYFIVKIFVTFDSIWNCVG